MKVNYNKATKNIRENKVLQKNKINIKKKQEQLYLFLFFAL